MPLSEHSLQSLQQARCGDPFSLLGLQQEDDHLCLRVWLRDAVAVVVHPLHDDQAIALTQRSEGFFEAVIEHRNDRFAYELAVTWRHSEQAERIRDPYSFWLLLSEWDLERFRDGSHHHVGDLLGAHRCSIDGVAGVRFSVWAPTAQRVSVVGDWNGFDGRWHPMRLRHPFGVWELFIPALKVGERYKFEILGRDGQVRVKADPYAGACEIPPATASVIADDAVYAWQDELWMQQRAERQPLREPMSIYEVHIGSWQRTAAGELLSYREFAPRLVEHCQTMGFTHVEFLPLAGHIFAGSWGYQVTSHYAVDSRFGSADDLCFLIDCLHQAGIAVLMDFVPGALSKR